MRQPKPSDLQALDVLQAELDQMSAQLTVIRGRMVQLRDQIRRYITQEEESINVSTAHGLSADNT
jgi:flagellar hook-associated protein FlgK